ncbi:MAG: 30S ribosomal protein S1 [Myxococcales bacterium]|nr:30S ribosomal protein S1 [Myxococcales bacterium]MCB9525665.1 30S ribosomal protein S1 [Myxococcales bacterium]
MSDIKQAPAPQADLETSFQARSVSPGDIVKGRISKIAGEVAFIDYGARSEGYIALNELKGEDGELRFNEGDELEAEVVATRGAVQLSRRNMRAQEILGEIEQAYKDQVPVEGAVVATNKGGYEIRVRGVRAFCPSRQFSLRFEREPSSHIGKHYLFKVTEFGNGKNLVVSRRALLEAEESERSANLTSDLRVGDIKQGTVTHLKPFGAFVDLGNGLEGMVHVSEISHERINQPADKLNPGDAVEVKVIRVDQAKGKVALSMKALADDPFATFVDAVKFGAPMQGTVKRVQPFGAFVEIAPGIDGLLHVSGITAERRIEHPGEVLTVGQELTVMVEKVDRDKKRIGLLTPEVWEKRQPVVIPCKTGDVLEGPVAKVEKFGVFVSIGEKVQALIPNSEMDTDRGADHGRDFPPGTQLKFKIIEVDAKRGRIRASRKALKYHDEEVAFAEYRKQSEVPKALGSFGDLLKDFLNK